MRSSIRNALKGISAGIPVNNQPPPTPIQTQSSQYPGLPRDKGLTTLGDYRMSSAIYEGISLPPIQLDEAKPKTVTFQSDGNNVYQPQNTDVSTAALISKLGDQKFKYGRNDPYAKYMAYNKLERDLKEAEKNASFTDLTAVREIVRDAVEKRRTQNEQDFLRKMLDSGLSMEDAKDEIENVRRANNLKEANMIDDRNYQSKMALKAFANKRGITTSIEEPLSHSGAINNPQMNELMAKAAGMPERAFGNSPLDIERLAKTPGFYKRFLRKSGLSQEQADRDAAAGALIAQGTSNVGIKNLAQLSALERQRNIEGIRENIAFNLDSLVNKRDKNISKIPPTIFAAKVVDLFNSSIEKNVGDKVLTRPISLTRLEPAQLLFAINYIVNRYGNGSNVAALKEGLKTIGAAGFAPNVVKNNLIKLASELTPDGSDTVRLPIITRDFPVTQQDYLTFARDFINKDTTSLTKQASNYETSLLKELDTDEIPLSTEALPEIDISETPLTGKKPSARQTRRRMVTRVVLKKKADATAVDNNTIIQPTVAAAVSANNEYIPNKSNARLDDTIGSLFRQELEDNKFKDKMGIKPTQIPKPVTSISSAFSDAFAGSSAAPLGSSSMASVALATPFKPQPRPEPKKLDIGRQVIGENLDKKLLDMKTNKPEKKPLGSMFKKDLQALAVTLGVSKYGNMAEIIERIEKSGKY